MNTRRISCFLVVIGVNSTQYKICIMALVVWCIEGLFSIIGERLPYQTQVKSKSPGHVSLDTFYIDILLFYILFILIMKFMLVKMVDIRQPFAFTVCYIKED